MYIDPLGLEPYSQDFWNAYLNYDKYRTQDVWNTVGGSLGTTYMGENSCATRVSYGLNYGGEPIPAGVDGGNRNYGGDNLRYILSARELRKYLNKEWGSPTTTLNSYSDVMNFQSSLKKGETAIVSSDGHASVLTNSYKDPYVGGFGGDVWLLPNKP